MSKLLSLETKTRIRQLRKKGHSLPEIKSLVAVGYGTIFRYTKDVEIGAKYKNAWLLKRHGSVGRKLRLEKEAHDKASFEIRSLDKKEKLMFLSALYWCEGSKKDFSFTNSDPEMINIFVSSLRELLGLTDDALRVSIRLYEDLDQDMCLDYWSKITGVSKTNITSVDILRGKKTGKLSYGMCRIRVKKGGNMLKYLIALRNRIVEIF